MRTMSERTTQERLHLSLLGTFKAASHLGAPVRLTMRKPRALLAFLALHPREPQTRERIAALLWPDTAAAQARLNLRQTLFLVRRALGTGLEAIITDVDGSLGIDPSRVVVDAVEFQKYARQDTPHALATAGQLYRGDLLQGFDLGEEPFEEWLTAERERLRETAIEGLAKLLRHHMDNEEPEAAISVGIRLLALDPCQEAVHRTLMRLYAVTHRRAAALRQFEACAVALKREFGLEPAEETRALHGQIAGARDLQIA